MFTRTPRKHAPAVKSWLMFYMRDPTNPRRNISMCLPVIPEMGYDEVIERFAPEMLPYKDRISPIETWEIPDPIFAPYDNPDGFEDTINYDHIINYTHPKYHTRVNKERIYGHTLNERTERALEDELSWEINKLIDYTGWVGDDTIHSEMLGCIIINQALEVLPQGEYELSDKFVENVAKRTGIRIR